MHACALTVSESATSWTVDCQALCPLAPNSLTCTRSRPHQRRAKSFFQGCSFFFFFSVHIGIFIAVLRAQQQPSPAAPLDRGSERTRAAQSPGCTTGKRRSFVALSPSAGRICRCSHRNLAQPTGRFPVRVGGLSLSHRETSRCFKK